MKPIKFIKRGNYVSLNIATLEDGEYLLKTFTPPRNYEQLKLYWTLLTLVEKESGNSRDYLHELMKKEYLSKRKLVKLPNKRVYAMKILSTSKLSRKEFATYYEQVSMYFAKYGYILPPKDSPEMQSLLDSAIY